MRKAGLLIISVLCALLMLGCSQISVIPPESTVPATTAVPATFPETKPTAPPANTEPAVLPTENLHSPLYLTELPVEDVIGFFNEVCLSAEYINSGDPSVLQKWTLPLIYRIHGQATEEDRKTLERFAAELNQIPGFPGIREVRDPEDANLDIFFCSQSDFIGLMGDNFYGADGGVTFWYEQNQIYCAVIGIRTDLDQELRNSVILEELYNGLGPVQDTLLRSDSIIYSGFSQPQALTPTDRLILELLYHPDMECGMTQQQCETVIRSLYY